MVSIEHAMIAAFAIILITMQFGKLACVADFDDEVIIDDIIFDDVVVDKDNDTVKDTDDSTTNGIADV